MIRSVLLLCFLSNVLPAQHTVRYDLPHLLKKNALTIVHRQADAQSDSGREYLSLNEAVDEGLVWIDGVSFSTGTIEVELKGQDVFQRSFVGIAFHGANDSTFEAVYFRPFHFRSDDPVRKGRRVQYISLPEHPWQVLREQFPGAFENSVDPAPDPDAWFRTRIVVTAKDISVFVNGADEPCLIVRSMSSRSNGRVGLYTADRSGGAYHRLSISHDGQLRK